MSDKERILLVNKFYYPRGGDCIQMMAVALSLDQGEQLAEDWILRGEGCMIILRLDIFFPQDGHAPGITPDGVKKVIVKVKA